MQDLTTRYATQREAELRAEIAHLEKCPKTEENAALLERAYDSLYCIIHDC